MQAARGCARSPGGRRARSTPARRGAECARAVGGELEDAIGRKRADRQVVVAGPAEAAQVGAAAHDFDQEARAELGVGREDRRRRRIERVGASSPPPSSRPAGASAPGFGSNAGDRAVGAVVRRRRATGCRSRARAASRRSSSSRDPVVRGHARSRSGISISPSPAAITSANSASGSGFTNVTAPPITTSGSRAVARRGPRRQAGQPQHRQHVDVVPLERDREREDVEVARPASAIRASAAARRDASCARSSCFGGRNTRSHTTSSMSLKRR